MAAFNWRSIYRIVKNQRSPEIEERGKVFSAEYASLLGACAWCLKYAAETNVRRAIDKLGKRTAVELVGETVKQMIEMVDAYKYLFEAEPITLDYMTEIGQMTDEERAALGPVRQSFKYVGTLISKRAGIIGGARFE